MKQNLLLLLFTFSSSLIWAQSDPWNTYQWNRKNALAINGQVDRSPWYEWWYYKIVIPETGKSYFFVYGVVNPWDIEQELKGTRAYVGMGDFQKRIQVEDKFSVDDFHASYTQTLVEIKNNVATDKTFVGLIYDESGNSYEWDVKINKQWTYNAEGWMTGSMITDIEWYPAQASASCTGTITDHGEKISFENAPCYQDRNWGKSFPDWWTWIVSNQFEGHPGSALAVGGGKPRVRGNRTPIASVSIGFTHEGKDYAFRPTDFQIVNTEVNFGKWKVMGMSNKYKIEVEAFAAREQFMDLQFIAPTGEIFHDYETLTGKVTVKLYKKEAWGWKIFADLVSNYAGIEFASAKNYGKNYY